MTGVGKIGAAVVGTLSLFVLWAKPGLQPPPPPRPPGVSVPARLADIQRKLGVIRGVNATAVRALEYSRAYFAEAQRREKHNRLFAADRFAGAADSMIHVAEHQQHLQEGGRPKGPPPLQEIKDHLQRVYFRVSQADFFLKETHDRHAVSFPKWARDFYQMALRALDRSDLIAADENAKCAEEVVKALENLAQAASPVEIPPPPGPPPPQQ